MVRGMCCAMYTARVMYDGGAWLDCDNVKSQPKLYFLGGEVQQHSRRHRLAHCPHSADLFNRQAQKTSLGPTLFGPGVLGCVK